jgi:LmbE family N-acetylglucosaminyl deacetylase
MRAMSLAKRMASLEDHGAALLCSLADPRRAAIDAAHVMLVVAHPDDETVAIGAQLARLRGMTIVLVTDGAPRDLHDARAHGFASAEHYAAARRHELGHALAIAGIEPTAVVYMDLPDQQAALQLDHLTRRMARLFAARRTQVATTHAYEGGHPDHDATAFAVHAASGLLQREGQVVSIVEAPFYHWNGQATVVQRFCEGEDGLAIALTAEERELKSRMIAAHATQSSTLAPFSVNVERFRVAPAYDFASLPNGGRVLYDLHPWGLTSDAWLRHARRTLHRLGLRRQSCD